MGYPSQEMHPSRGMEGAAVQLQVVQPPSGLPSIITEARMEFKRGSDPLFFPPVQQPYSQEVKSQALELPLQKRVDAHTKEHWNTKETQRWERPVKGVTLTMEKRHPCFPWRMRGVACGMTPWCK